MLPDYDPGLFSIAGFMKDVTRAGANSGPELDCLANSNSNSNSGIGIELAFPSLTGIGIELELP